MESESIVLPLHHPAVDEFYQNLIVFVRFMVLIEFAGMPRAGKSTTTKLLSEHIPGLTIHPERFDLVPDDLKDNPFKYNMCYAQYCINQLTEARKTPGDHIFERGVLDRIAIGKANFYFGRFSEKEFNEYMEVLIPFISAYNLTIVFNIDANTSLSRAKTPKGITSKLEFLIQLEKAYQELSTFPKVHFTPPDASLEKLETFCKNKIEEVL
jgi:deoxyadenosine/deoxycytidine kinase